MKRQLIAALLIACVGQNVLAMEQSSNETVAVKFEGGGFHIDVDSNIIIGELKEKILAKRGFEGVPDSYKLVFTGQKMQEDLQLSVYNIESRSIYLVKRLSQAQPQPTQPQSQFFVSVLTSVGPSIENRFTVYKIPATKDMLVRELKGKVLGMADPTVNYDDYKLRFMGRFIEDNRQLSYYNLSKSGVGVIDLVHRRLQPQPRPSQPQSKQVFMAIDGGPVPFRIIPGTTIGSIKRQFFAEHPDLVQGKSEEDFDLLLGGKVRDDSYVPSKELDPNMVVFYLEPRRR